ncbi:MAG: AAA family ATPase, partial [Methanobacteriaceae archaeon]
MIINSLSLTNFKSHINTKIDFNLGLSIIIGENGAGKSTILEAISYALFKQFTGKKINDLIKRNQKKMVVELIFKSHSNEYKVIREKTLKSSKAA